MGAIVPIDSLVHNEFAPAVFALDAQKRIQLWTQGMETLSGVTAAQALGQPCYQVVRCWDMATQAPCGPGRCHLWRHLEAGHLKGQYQLVIGRDNGGTPHRVQAVALPPGVGPRALVFVYPSGKAFPSLLSGLVGDVSALGHIVAALTPQDLNGVLQRALTVTQEATGAEASELFLLEPLGQQMVLAGHCGLFAPAFEQITRFRWGEGFPGLVAASGAPVLTLDLLHDDRYLRTWVKEKGFQHYACVPLRAGSQLMGCLNIATRQPDADLAAKLPLLTAISAPLGHSVYTWLRQAQEQLGELTLHPTISWEENLRLLIEDMLHRVVEASHAAAGGAVVYDLDSGMPLLQVVQGVEGRDLGPREGCLVLGERRPLPVSSCPGYACGLRPGGDRLCLPLVAGSRALGMVCLLPGRELLAYGTGFNLAVSLIQRASTMLSHALTYRQLHRAALEAEQQRLAEKLGQTVGAATTAVAGPTPILDIRCLGPFQLLRNGQALTATAFRRRQALTALKLLAVHRGRPLPAEVLMEHLWPDAEPGLARNRLYGVIHALRQAVEPSPEVQQHVIRTQGDSYYLNTEVVRIDVDEFLALFRRGVELERRGETQTALATFREAAQLYRGDFLEDERYEEWCWGEREHLRETYLELLRRLAGILRSQGELEEGIRCLRQALLVDPVREELYRELMDFLAGAGRRDEALRQYRTCCRQLRQELGVSPLPQTENLYRRILHSNGS